MAFINAGSYLLSHILSRAVIPTQAKRGLEWATRRRGMNLNDAALHAVLEEK